MSASGRVSPASLLSGDGKSSTGLNENVAALLCYILGPFTWIVALIFFFIEQKSKYVKFHAMQALLLSAIFFVLWLIFMIVAGATLFLGIWVVFMAIEWIIFLAAVAISVICIIQAYSKKDIVLPIIGPIAYKIASK
ncbi:MAG: hypothetical protein Q8O09_03005 [Bacillota bacterium]|nr:hypothetical protein [Bacillota bacterium]